jgi:hypothetical protein
MKVLVAILLAQLTGPGGQRIDINTADVTSVRDIHGEIEGHYAKGTSCIVVMSNGKFIAVREDCDTVRNKLKGGGLSGQQPCVLVCGEVRASSGVIR